MEDVLFPILERYASTDGQDIFEEVGQRAAARSAGPCCRASLPAA